MNFFLADDLSGALDAAAAFHRAGRGVRIALAPTLPETSADDEVVAITTETRNASAAEAAEKVKRMLVAAQRRGGRLLYKKIDSTMRGPVAAELGALLEAMPAARVLFAPANPAVGRTVRGGVLLVRGVPVAETDFGRDPVSPVRESALSGLLGAAAGERVTIADAETANDLDAAVERMAADGDPWVAVGSGALAVPVAKRMGGPLAVGEKAWPRVEGRGVLMICGSAHAGNRVQAERLWRERGVGMREVKVGQEMRVGGTAAPAAGAERQTLMIEAVRAESALALRAITQAAAEAILGGEVRRVFVTGGETAFAICGALGIGELRYFEEIEPGVCVASAETARGTMLLAVKPGGFGDEGTWVRVWDRLTKG